MANETNTKQAPAPVAQVQADKHAKLRASLAEMKEKDPGNPLIAQLEGLLAENEAARATQLIGGQISVKALPVIPSKKEKAKDGETQGGTVSFYGINIRFPISFRAQQLVRFCQPKVILAGLQALDKALSWMPMKTTNGTAAEIEEARLHVRKELDALLAVYGPLVKK